MNRIYRLPVVADPGWLQGCKSGPGVPCPPVPGQLQLELSGGQWVSVSEGDFTLRGHLATSGDIFVTKWGKVLLATNL